MKRDRSNNDYKFVQWAMSDVELLTEFDTSGCKMEWV
jgi:hypothetical protein